VGIFDLMREEEKSATMLAGVGEEHTGSIPP
jgi:hypothetical protein